MLCTIFNNKYYNIPNKIKTSTETIFMTIYNVLDINKFKGTSGAECYCTK